jgi:hypothetical protein
MYLQTSAAYTQDLYLSQSHAAGTREKAILIILLGAWLSLSKEGNQAAYLAMDTAISINLFRDCL